MGDASIPHRLCRLVGIRGDGTRIVLADGLTADEAEWRRKVIDAARIFVQVQVEEYSSDADH